MAEDSRSSTDPVPIDIQFQVEVTRLHCAHLRTLLGRLESELTMIGQTFATPEPPPFASVTPHLNEVTKQSEFIALETERLRGYVHSLLSLSPGTGEEVGTRTEE